MDKSDLTKSDKTYYRAKPNPEIVQIKPAVFVSVTGKGDPSGEQFAAKITALYPVAYALKFESKAQGKDFVVAKLEGLWWYDESRYAGVSPSEAPQVIPRSEWSYRLLIRLPEYIGATGVEWAIRQAFEKKHNPLIREVEYFKMNEGKCVQMLHTGPFDTEPESLKKMLDFIHERKLARNGLHHEIYLSDFRKTVPEKLKTILREPVK